MRAITVIPGHQGTVALTDMPEPPDSDGPVLVRTHADNPLERRAVAARIRATCVERLRRENTLG